MSNQLKKNDYDIFMLDEFKSQKNEKWLFPPPVLEHGCCMLLQRSHNIPLNQPACSEDSDFLWGRYNKNIMTFCSTVVGLVRAKKHI